MPASVAEDLAAAALDMARSFAAGATLWCSAPEWPSHAQHLAVEFVHPVIMGKRALPAAPVDGDLVSTLRVVAAPGDIFAAVSRGDDPVVSAAMRRAPAWGLRSFWIGTGERPPAGAADHVLWLDDDVAPAAFGGRLVLIYHLLWELTHVCFEHSGLLAPAGAGADAGCDDEVCVTCSDEGRLAEVVGTGPGFQAQVRTAAGIEGIDTTLIGTPSPGDLVLVHAGSAVTLLDG
jgi:hypothetical protein